LNHGYVSLVIAATLLSLAGCAGVATRPTAPVAPAAQPPGQGQAAPGAATAPLPMAPLPMPPVPRAEMSGNHAVIALLDRAQTDSDAGQREAAGASLERALRIEPRNPWLWLQLAQLRLAQGQYAQAITLARKSNSFAGHQPRVQAGNWQVIAQARVAQGDSAGAEQAFKLSADLAEQARAQADRDAGFHMQ
jgi:predicted Zn-dependent protease